VSFSTDGLTYIDTGRTNGNDHTHTCSFPGATAMFGCLFNSSLVHKSREAAELPTVRRATESAEEAIFVHQAMWGGWDCHNCGCKMDGRGAGVGKWVSLDRELIRAGQIWHIAGQAHLTWGRITPSNKQSARRANHSLHQLHVSWGPYGNFAYGISPSLNC
jgi:hypothetical protein